MIVRICTEDKNENKVLALCQQYYKGFTSYKAWGVWEGQYEQALVIEIAVERGGPEDVFTARNLAKAIKALNSQQSVLIEYIPATHEFI